MAYEEMKQRLKGSIAPVITPFDSEGNIDFETMKKLIDWQIESGSHGISVTGTSGEPSSLTIEERKKVMETAKKAVNGRVPFIPATGSTNHAETLELTKFAQEIGADAAMVIVPYYNRPSQQALYKHFKAVADSVDIPIIIYNIPGRTAVNLEVRTMARLVEDCPNIIGAKESNKDFEHVNRVLLYCGRDFLLFSGIELLCYPMLAIGGAGSISATANVTPAKVAEMHNAWFEGDVERAQNLHFELMELNDILFIETNPGPVKAALGMMGKITPKLRLPLDLPSEEVQEKIRQTLVKYNLLTEVTS
ncbi:2,4-dihydroxyhept-2-ene-1,7-dioic acid aldolase [Parageobacillus thermoglucosidasius]|uniref:2,4-dihydroxyhept-2-ene-1,7-dioic acid aldolase n=1 Tax=Parageobacillus thermoglucosidasius TaxID=1426 RepID=UPI00025B76B8|nr:2,4-dihydroxyhept-2-ene-1,7-dioic acid aldolase [Parageobacillus thermoglucosidasius]KYD13464.1 Dihydrodipicolinate synthase [Anoxybacillus flavithermus]REK59119.1 MAG: 2,4-dihydroxyhept-2-ene-1,7-dioic acid aldolase [Geobacillus sp.]EID45587.1 2,4-dihydroxyhept-2-ene-1,7-dioic acid aldolase [Parageobacillus thermoglucosidasius TNO-09.020]OAO85163.1 Dihydrodipicolinate synthase [Parageobacillus thermoglucosidasius]GMO00394.1 2,4-dihydroxyhept-2-ene-1,7-dioic acid aldolase [Parageobacillus t